MNNQPGCSMVLAEACSGIGEGALGSGTTVGFSTSLGLVGEALTWNEPLF